MTNLKHGISIIIPTYNGRERIIKCVESIRQQSIDKTLYEIIIIVNGIDDGTTKLLHQYIDSNTIKNIQVLYTIEASASKARNIGVENAQYKYIVFIDDDDYVSKNYLACMLQYAENATIAICPIVSNSPNLIDNYINHFPSKISNSIIKMRFITMNAGKIIPTWLLNKYKFNESLQSSEDMALYSIMLLSEDVNILIIPYDRNIFYHRTIRNNSLSRQAATPNFVIAQRIAVISSIISGVRSYKCLIKNPRKFIFLISRILGEIIYGVRIVIRDILKKIKQ